MKAVPLISVLIVNWNGEKWLKNCLDSLKAQTYKNYEIIFIDNASTDGSVNFVKQHHPDIKLIQNDENVGFAGGNNIGYKHSEGQYILLLNNDTIVEPGFLNKILMAFEKIPNLGSVQAKLVLMDDRKKLDVAGSYWTDTGFLYHYGFGKNESLEKYNKPMPFFSNKGAAMLISRTAIERVGLFDDDFWCYYEETDFCHRLWLAGYECWYWPGATVFHAMGGTSLAFKNDFIQYHNFKNKLLSFIKNFEYHTLLWLLPVFLLEVVGLASFWLLKGKFKHAVSIMNAISWNIHHLPQTLKKRKSVQDLRQVSDKTISQKVKKNPRLIFYKHLLSGNIEDYVD